MEGRPDPQGAAYRKDVLSDTLDISVSLGVYNEPSEQVRMSTLSSVPYAYMKAAHFRDTVLEFSFTPRRDRMSLVLMYKGGDGSALSIDDVAVFYADGFERDTLVQMPFADSSEVREHWRSSSWPDSMIVLDSMIWGTLSHDTTPGRMRVDLTENPFGDEGTENELGSLSIRRLSGLEVDREYEVSTRIYTDGANRLYRIGMNLFNASEFGMGIINDAGPHVQLDSLTMADSLVFRFRATEGDMVLAISAASRIGEAYHYYLDDFRLRDGMVRTVDCSNSNLNLQYADDNRYRYGFNGMEFESQVSPGTYSAEFWMYDGRLGRRWNVDPELYPWNGGYTTFNNNPVMYNDPEGNQPPPATGPPSTTTVFSKATREFTEKVTQKALEQAKPNWFVRAFRTASSVAAVPVSTIVAVLLPNNIGGGDLKDPWDQTKRVIALTAYEQKRTPMINPSKEPSSALYELRAKEAGWYTCADCYLYMNNTNIRVGESGSLELFLEKDELWKYGKTNEPNGRYSENSYEKQNFDMNVIFTGTESEVLIKEKQSIVSYPVHPENIERAEDKGIYLPRPPGNKRDK